NPRRAGFASCRTASTAGCTGTTWKSQPALAPPTPHRTRRWSGSSRCPGRGEPGRLPPSGKTIARLAEPESRRGERQTTNSSVSDRGGPLMTWLQRYHVRHYVGNSIWILPTLSILAALGAVRLLHRFEEVMGWQSNLDPETARSVLATMAASMFTF